VSENSREWTSIDQKTNIYINRVRCLNSRIIKNTTRYCIAYRVCGRSIPPVGARRYSRDTAERARSVSFRSNPRSSKDYQHRVKPAPFRRRDSVKRRDGSSCSRWVLWSGHNLAPVSQPPRFSRGRLFNLTGHCVRNGKPIRRDGGAPRSRGTN